MMVLCQVVKCSGVSGSNAEYVIRLADFIRQHIPHDDDNELFQLDAKVRRLLTSSDIVVDRSSRSQERPSTLADMTSSPMTAFSHCDVTDREMLAQKHSHVAVTVLAG